MNWSFWKFFGPATEPLEEKVEKFPCSSDNCLIRMACTKPCEKIEMDDDKLKELFMKYNACPDCGSESFMEGPSGGAATNVKCNGCGHWFNFGLPLFIQRIHVSKDRFYE
jgi:ribosomal protein S27E